MAPNPALRYFLTSSEMRACSALLVNSGLFGYAAYSGIGAFPLAFLGTGMTLCQRLLARGPQGYRPAGTTPLMNRGAIVTGANCGVGLFTALGLAKLGCTVVLACRSQSRAQEAMAAIQKEVPGAKLRFIPLDLEDLASVRKFTDSIFQAVETGQRGQQELFSLPSLDLLVNNAGIMTNFKDLTARTPAGFEKCVGVNFIGHFVLTERMLPLLKESKGRIINLSSCANIDVRFTDGRPTAYLSKLHRTFEETGAINEKPKEEYGLSKALMAMYARELAQRLASFGVTTCSVHPGGVRSEIFRGLGAVGWFIKYPGALVFKSAREGACCSLHCATLPSDRLVSGGYYQDCHLALDCLAPFVMNDEECRNVVDWARHFSKP